MGGLFGVISEHNCINDLFFGVDYHSHLGTRRAGMAVYTSDGIERTIHNIENAPFRTKFENDLDKLNGRIGIGCISDTDPQPLLIRSHLGTYAITTVGRINNHTELIDKVLKLSGTHFTEMSGGKINATELVAALINMKSSIPEGIRYAHEQIDGSMTILVMVEDGIYAARDLMGRTPLILGKKDGGYCATSESFAYLNLGYSFEHELGAGEVAFISSSGVEIILPPQPEMKICAFLWAYFGYPTASYEGVGVEAMRYRCGERLALEADDIEADFAAGVPDSGTAHAIGYANRSGIPFARPLIKYTPTWPRSFMPPNQSMRDLVAKMKLIPVQELIKGKRLLFVEDSIVRGTQLRETAEFLFENGAKEVHIKAGCPPLMFGCKYLNFSRSTSDMDLITRRTIERLENSNPYDINEYVDETTPKHKKMVECICKEMNFTSLQFLSLDGMLSAIGIDKSKVCTYCWSGK